MTGIVSALITDDHLHIGRQEICETTFALVSPLSTDDDGGWHLLKDS